ncbi:MAG TPA: glutamine amidotransferase [Vicinamibacterales bacterium]|jgi:uncharacterized membrane protein|nr:glutamine amidotransferase [Vicinamibacterales bacterium]
MGSAFRVLFKYPLVVFEQGHFTFALSRSLTFTLAAAAVIALGALLTYRGAWSEERPRDRAVLIGLRVAIVAALLFCLARPILVLKAAVPQQNFLGILLDDSKSMTIADTGGQPRTDFVQQQLALPDSPLLSALSQRFVLRFFRFSSSSDRVQSAADLKYAGTASRLGPALERARDELAGLPLAGLVMVSDGADTSDATLDTELASLKARLIPVFTVGVGQERFAKDIQISRVETPRSTLKGTTLSVDVVVTQTGYSGSTVPLNVEDNGRLVGTQQVTLPPDGESASVRVSFTASDAGARLFRFSIPTQPGEQVTQNNARDALLEVTDRHERILYYEGEPRSEMAFIRRAIADDKNIDLDVLQRLAEEKYRRFLSEGNGNPEEELVAGFPKTREELFAYRAVILGSVEAASFTPDQLKMLADFVSTRGGTLLMLGGRRSFAEGGWAGTPVADVLPVELDKAAAKDTVIKELAVRPTRDGETFPAVQLADNEKASLAKWDDMPTVSAVNPIQRVKPGATILLSGTNGSRQQQVVLAYQPYGRGRSVAFPIQDSWHWKMDFKVPVDDMTHVMFWRRMMRWLVDGVGGPVELTTSNDRVEPGEPMKLTASVVDPTYTEVNDGRVTADVTAPSGKTTQVPLEWSVTKDGEYNGTFVPDEPGIYTVKTTASRGATDLGTSVAHVRASAGDAEYFDAAMRAPLMKRIAEDTGGRFFTPANAASLPEAISYSGRGVTVVEERDLWDMPIILLLLLVLVGSEWGYRRVRGMA